MKKLIAVSSFAFLSCFALAYAADDSSNTMSSSDTSNSLSQAGQTAKSCTDQNGVTFNKGEAGYKSCVSQMSKSSTSDSNQMSGQSGVNSDTSNSPNSMASSTPSSNP